MRGLRTDRTAGVIIAGLAFLQNLAVAITTPLAEDIAEALVANPDAAAYFDSLAHFYPRHICAGSDETARRPQPIHQPADLANRRADLAIPIGRGSLRSRGSTWIWCDVAGFQARPASVGPRPKHGIMWKTTTTQRISSVSSSGVPSAQVGR